MDGAYNAFKRSYGSYDVVENLARLHRENCQCRVAMIMNGAIDPDTEKKKGGKKRKPKSSGY